jgi:EAL domain-containing protein (putative c-di-GMP-specific phosphodiesterase class I)/CheY-like chemotaxis protein
MSQSIELHDVTLQDHSIDSVSKTVLVVDDDAEISRVVGRVLTGAGYDVLTADSGAAALDTLERRPVGTVLSDIQMPGMSGLELLGKVHSYDADLPVILMTGVPKLETAVDAIGSGALQYLVKPVVTTQLLEAVERASQAHRAARTRRAALCHYASRHRPTRERSGLEVRFEQALQSSWVAFQPIVDVDQRRIHGYEALLRSEEPTLPTPLAVIGAAEKLDRLPDVGRRVRTIAARSFVSAPEDSLLFVNLHARDLLDPNLYDPEAPLSQVAPRVVFEVTERMALDEVHDVQDRIRALRAMGFRIAIDDLGAGYAGLSSFAALEPDIAKLDMSLVRDVHQSSIRQRLIASMTSLCKEMKVEVIAEGVETREEYEMLRKLGCGLMQGFLFSRPGPFFAHVNVPF